MGGKVKMNRLTVKDAQGNWALKGVRWEDLREGKVITKEMRERLYGALWKLIQYENIGLEPEEVVEVNSFDKTNTSRLLGKLADEREKNRWIPVKERLPEEKEWIGYNKEISIRYMKRIEIAYMTDTVEYTIGYFDGYKWMDKYYGIIPNVVAWKIHVPYSPERSSDDLD